MNLTPMKVNFRVLQNGRQIHYQQSKRYQLRYMILLVDFFFSQASIILCDYENSRSSKLRIKFQKFNITL